MRVVGVKLFEALLHSTVNVISAALIEFLYAFRMMEALFIYLCKDDFTMKATEQTIHRNIVAGPSN